MLPLTEAEQQLVVFPLEMVTGCMEAVGGHAEVWTGERLGVGGRAHPGAVPASAQSGCSSWSRLPRCSHLRQKWGWRSVLSLPLL